MKQTKNKNINSFKIKSSYGSNPYHQSYKGILAKVASEVSFYIRKKMYDLFCKEFPDPQSVLDLGASSEVIVKEANYFEQFFPHKNRITAAGIEDAQHLEKEYPGLKFQKIEPNKKLPFLDKQFDVVFSNAVIEHVTEGVDRELFFDELVRVGKNIFITTPNKFYPLEFHTGVILIHFLFPKLFKCLLDSGKLSKFYRSNNLSPLGKEQLTQLAKSRNLKFKIYGVKLLGLTSNLILVIHQ